MQSIREIYKIGAGPSSSHTLGPGKAAALFRKEHPDSDRFRVILYGSLAKTGVGHHTDRAVYGALSGIETDLVFDTITENLPHENTLDLIAYRGGSETGRMRVFSIGGGDITIEGRDNTIPPEVYPEHSFNEISEFCKSRNIRISDYVYLHEGDKIKDYLRTVQKVMWQSVDEGISRDGILEGGLEVVRKAKYLYNQNQRAVDVNESKRADRVICAYAFAVGEQNASGGTVVTAPTCGAAGVMPAVLRYTQEKLDLPNEKIIDALATGGIIGNIVKCNASISGAECGCQAEIGTACAMAAGALCELYDMDIDKTEYAAEMSLEHHLGLTCDPVRGLVQIPCIERCAIAAMYAVNAVNLSDYIAGTRKITFDLAVRTMYQTGKDMPRIYRETSEGGLAKMYGVNPRGI
jgi:L-serine dehydratase